jgi:hypothetical protein
MGMFDYVRYEAPCPLCGAACKCWQSKDGPCVMAKLEVSDVRYFYANCPSCGAWVEANVEPPVDPVIRVTAEPR